MKTISTLFLSLMLSVLSPSLFAQTPGAPAANYSATPLYICVGDAVQFTDLSTNNPTSWQWTFNGGSPANSTSQNPSVTYNLPGKYNVVLNAGNAQGSNTKGTLNMVTVVECTSILEYDNLHFTISPNPVQSHIKLSGSSDAKYTLYNTIGVVIATGQVRAEEETFIQLNDVPSGIYILNMQNGSRTKSIRIVKE